MPGEAAGEPARREKPPHRVAIIQSSYIPWKGYFGIIGAVDTFVFLDDAQFTRRDWRNRNLIKTAFASRRAPIGTSPLARFALWG